MVIYGQQKLFDTKIRGILRAKSPILETEANPQFEKVECKLDQNK
jgi:hypothetical protein